MKQKAIFSGAQVFAVLITVMIVSFTSCGSGISPSTSSSTGVQANLPFSNFGNISARLFGLMTFEGWGQLLTYPSEFAIPPISISWMGGTFTGLLEEAGPGADITYQVHGSMSADGAWVDSMFFSREIIRPAINDTDFFRITLRNVPLVRTPDEQRNEQAVCNKAGSDVQRYLVKIEYANYISTDWSSTSCVAALKVTLASGPGAQASDGIQPRVPTM